MCSPIEFSGKAGKCIQTVAGLCRSYWRGGGDKCTTLSSEGVTSLLMGLLLRMPAVAGPRRGVGMNPEGTSRERQVCAAA